MRRSVAMMGPIRGQCRVWALPGPGERPTRSAQSAFPSHFCWRATLTSAAKPRVPCLRGDGAQAQQQFGGRERVGGGVVADRALDAERGQPVVEAAAAVAVRLRHQRRGERREVEPRPSDRSDCPHRRTRGAAPRDRNRRESRRSGAPAPQSRNAASASGGGRPGGLRAVTDPVDDDVGGIAGRRALAGRSRSCRRAGCRRRRRRRHRSRAGGRARDRAPRFRCRRRPSARPVAFAGAPGRASGAARRAPVHPG